MQRHLQSCQAATAR